MNTELGEPVKDIKESKQKKNEDIKIEIFDLSVLQTVDMLKFISTPIPKGKTIQL